MTYEEQKTVIQDWLDEDFSQWGPLVKHVRFTLTQGDGEQEGWRGRLIFCTMANTYGVTFAENYLGCIASSNIIRPGEETVRGNDLPDGEFNRGTWDNIILAALAYELVPLQEFPIGTLETGGEMPAPSDEDKSGVPD